jgi:hypothetical protein
MHDIGTPAIGIADEGIWGPILTRIPCVANE